MPGQQALWIAFIFFENSGAEGLITLLRSWHITPSYDSSAFIPFYPHFLLPFPISNKSGGF